MAIIKFWKKFNKTIRFTEDRKKYLENLPNLDDSENLITTDHLNFPRITVAGTWALIELVTPSVSESSQQLIKAVFSSMTSLEENHFPELKRIFSALRFHSETSNDSARLGYQVINFVVYSTPIIAVTQGVDHVSFQAAGLYLHDICCTYEHVSNLSYLSQMQNSLSLQYFENLHTPLADWMNNYFPQASTLNTGVRHLAWRISWHWIGAPIFRRLPPSLVSLGVLALTESDRGNTEDANDGRSNLAIEPAPVRADNSHVLGLPQMHPR